MNLLGFIRKWLTRVETREDLSFVLYTRKDCCLCATAWQELSKAQRRHRFQLDRRDVDADPELLALYGDMVPVVSVNGKVRFRGAVQPVLLRRLLEAKAR